MYVSRLGADARLHRARRITTGLARLHDDYLASAVRMEASPAPDNPVTWRIRLQRDLPPEFAVMAARAIHHARSALDELAAALVIASGGGPRGTSFPIALSARHFPEQQSYCLRGANQEALAAVQSVTPWRGVDNKL